MGDIRRGIEATQATFYCRPTVGGLKAGQVGRLKELERENGQPKRAVTGLMLDQQILKEAAEKTLQAALLSGSGPVL